MNNFDEELNEHDQSRRMLELIREGNRFKKTGTIKRLINEQNEPDSINLREQQPDVQNQEEKKFKDVISPRVKFNPLMVYPKTGNVEWSGEFQDSKLEWFYSLDDTNGIYITTNLLRLDSDTLDRVKKLAGFYDNWANEWANKVADEYRNKSTEEGTTETPSELGEAPDTGL